MGVNSLPKTVTRQRRDCDLNRGRTAPESSTLTSRLPSQPSDHVRRCDWYAYLADEVAQRVVSWLGVHRSLVLARRVDDGGDAQPRASTGDHPQDVGRG